SIVSVATRRTYWSEVITGMRATIPPKTTSNAHWGRRTIDCRTRWDTPWGATSRSSLRATHSSTPIRGPGSAGDAAGERSGGVGVPSLISHLLKHWTAEDAGRSEQHEHDEDGEDDDVLEGRGEVADRELLGDADDHPAQHRARDVSDAADDGARECLQAGAEAHVRLDVL